MHSGHAIPPASVQVFRPGWKNLAVFVAMSLSFCLVAMSRGPDANWDLLNYHQYNPFALLNKPLGFDIVPAQLQTFLNPALDLPYYYARTTLNHWPALLACLLALPQALATFLAYRIALEILPGQARARELLALTAAAFGATGAASLPTLATTQSEMIPACFLLGGLWLALRFLGDRQASYARIFGAGCLCGIAFGLKMTLLPYCIAVGVAVALTCGFNLRRKLFTPLAFGLGAAIGGLLAGGPWWLTLYSTYGNPIFPYYNNIFHSPFYDAVQLTDDRFKPASLSHALFYPFFWAARRQTLIAELTFRDPRFALSYVSIVVAAFGALAVGKNRLQSGPWLDARGWCVLIFTALGFALWEKQFSILRYLAPLELISGVALLLALRPLLAGRIWLYVPHAALVGVAALSFQVTVYPEWGHAPRGNVAASVVLPELAPDSLVILLDSTPSSFIAAYAPKTVRFVGANNNLVRPGLRARIQQDIEQVIRTHPGPLWGLEWPSDDPGKADATLSYYGLRRRADCVTVQSNLNNNASKMCPLVRADAK